MLVIINTIKINIEIDFSYFNDDKKFAYSMSVWIKTYDYSTSSSTNFMLNLNNC